MTDRQLINLAEQASRNAYVPYSHFAVGVALECRDGTVFTGCNIENAALGSTICAERTAACKAVSEGRRHPGMEHLLPLFHAGMGTLLDYADGAPLFLDNLDAFLHDRPMRNVVDLDVGY